MYLGSSKALEGLVEGELLEGFCCGCNETSILKYLGIETDKGKDWSKFDCNSCETIRYYMSHKDFYKR